MSGDVAIVSTRRVSRAENIRETPPTAGLAPAFLLKNPQRCRFVGANWGSGRLRKPASALHHLYSKGAFLTKVTLVEALCAAHERSIVMSRATIPAPPALVLAAQTAEELMVPNPISLQGDATVPEAVSLMTDRGFSAAPVIDEAGRPIGVLSRSDVLIHEREQVRHAQPAEEVHAEGQSWRSRHEGFSIEIADSTSVSDIMTPTLFSVRTNTAAADVVKRLYELKVQQLFVVDETDSLVGVISALDIVRNLMPQT